MLDHLRFMSPCSNHYRLPLEETLTKGCEFVSEIAKEQSGEYAIDDLSQRRGDFFEALGKTIAKYESAAKTCASLASLDKALLTDAINGFCDAAVAKPNLLTCALRYQHEAVRLPTKRRHNLRGGNAREERSGAPFSSAATTEEERNEADPAKRFRVEHGRTPLLGGPGESEKRAAARASVCV